MHMEILGYPILDNFSEILRAVQYQDSLYESKRTFHRHRTVRLYTVDKDDIPEEYEIPLLYEILRNKENRRERLNELFKIKRSYLSEVTIGGSCTRARYEINDKEHVIDKFVRGARMSLFQYL